MLFDVSIPFNPTYTRAACVGVGLNENSGLVCLSLILSMYKEGSYNKTKFVCPLVKQKLSSAEAALQCCRLICKIFNDFQQPKCLPLVPLDIWWLNSCRHFNTMSITFFIITQYCSSVMVTNFIGTIASFTAVFDAISTYVGTLILYICI